MTAHQPITDQELDFWKQNLKIGLDLSPEIQKRLIEQVEHFRHVLKTTREELCWLLGEPQPPAVEPYFSEPAGVTPD